jgi:hypothetical protein
MNNRPIKERAIAENYEAFEALLPLLLQTHKDEFALLNNRVVVGFFHEASTAQKVGAERFPDGAFSVQKVEENAIDLGFYSYARYRRPA